MKQHTKDYKETAVKYYLKHNNDYVAIAFINKTHYPHDIDESREIILNSIKTMIDKYYINNYGK